MGRKVDNAYAELVLGGKTEKTESFSINAFEIKNITGFVDTTGVSNGEQDLDVILHYAGEESENTFKVMVGKAGDTAMYMTVFAIIIIILIAVFFFYKKKKGKK